jgi:penicillin-binding protein 1C
MRFGQLGKILLSLLVLLCAGFVLWPVHPQKLGHSDLASTRIFDRNGTLLREVPSAKDRRSQWVALTTIPSYVSTCFIVAEDKRFYQHWGVDLLALLRAVWQNLSQGEVVSGASTITQQLARRIYHLPRHWFFKPVEALLALRLEIWLSKEQILEQYLNRVPFGNQVYGIGAAADLYFKKSAAFLSVEETAFLAGLPQAPSRFNPYSHFKEAKKRQEHILDLLLARGVLNAQQHQHAKATPIRLESPKSSFRAPYFCRMILEQPRLSQSSNIRTTLDDKLQSTIELLVRGHLDRLVENNVTNAAVLVLDNSDNSVVAWIGSGDFFDERHDGQVDGVSARRQPGSALKPFTYALALENGYTTASILPDIDINPTLQSAGFVENYDETYHGPVRLRTALACSYNVPAVRVVEGLGVDLLLSRLLELGCASLQKEAVFYGPGLTLGNGEVTLLELTNAYATLANGGSYRAPRYLFSDETVDKISVKQVFSQSVSFLISDILSDAGARAPAFGSGNTLNLPFPCAAKTGTSKDFRDNWTVGFTTNYTVGVWVGNFDGSPMYKVSGITGAAPLFRDIMLLLHPAQPPGGFVPPPNVIKRRVCAQSGQLPNPLCPTILDEYFVKGTSPHSTCRVHKQLTLDRRNGLLATEQTPARFRESRVFQVWPDEYSPWLMENGFELPPTRYSRAGEESPLVINILSPADGDIFKLDPILRREFQTIQLEATVSMPPDSMKWYVDEHELAVVRKTEFARWPLHVGKHGLRAVAYCGNRVVSSKNVLIDVL